MSPAGMIYLDSKSLLKIAKYNMYKHAFVCLDKVVTSSPANTKNYNKFIDSLKILSLLLMDLS